MANVIQSPAARLEQKIRGQLGDAMLDPQPPPKPRALWWRWRWAISSAVAVLLLAAVLYTPIKNRYDAHLMCREAVEDHREEVIENQPRKWRTADADVQVLLTRLGETSLPKTAGPLTFERARICTLGGRDFIHAVYSSGRREYSVFIAPVEKAPSAHTIPASLVRAESIANTAVAEYRSNAHMLIVAGDSQVGELLEASQQLAGTM